MADVKAQVYIGYDFDVDGVYDTLNPQQRQQVAEAIEAPIKEYFNASLPSWESVNLGEPVDGLIPILRIQNELASLLAAHNTAATAANKPTFSLDSRRGRGLFSVHRRFRDGLRRYGLEIDEGNAPVTWTLQAIVDGNLIETEPYIAAYWTIDWASNAETPIANEAESTVGSRTATSSRDVSSQASSPTGRRAGSGKDFDSKRSATRRDRNV